MSTSPLKISGMCSPWFSALGSVEHILFKVPRTWIFVFWIRYSLYRISIRKLSSRKNPFWLVSRSGVWHCGSALCSLHYTTLEMLMSVKIAPSENKNFFEISPNAVFFGNLDSSFSHCNYQVQARVPLDNGSSIGYWLCTASDWMLTHCQWKEHPVNTNTMSLSKLQTACVNTNSLIVVPTSNISSAPRFSNFSLSSKLASFNEFMY